MFLTTSIQSKYGPHMIYSKLKQMREKQYTVSPNRNGKSPRNMLWNHNWDVVGFMQMCELSENRMAMKTFVDSDALKTPSNSKH